MATSGTSHTVGRVLTRVMRERRCNQTELARAFRVPQSTLSRWMAGERRPRERRARLELLRLGVDPRWL
jgi:hypothetical protein